MLKDVVGAFELRMLHEIQEFVKQNTGYYGTISAIINEVEKPKQYRVHIDFYDEEYNSVEFHDVTKYWVRDNYLYIERRYKTVGYNLNKVVAYSVSVYKEDTE